MQNKILNTIFFLAIIFTFGFSFVGILNNKKTDVLAQGAYVTVAPPPTIIVNPSVVIPLPGACIPACSSGYTCYQGACLDRWDCRVNSSLCTGTQVCNNGTCIDRVDCRNGGQYSCGAGATCNQSTGMCVYPLMTSSRGCPPTNDTSCAAHGTCPTNNCNPGRSVTVQCNNSIYEPPRTYTYLQCNPVPPSGYSTTRPAGAATSCTTVCNVCGNNDTFYLASTTAPVSPSPIITPQPVWCERCSNNNACSRASWLNNGSPCSAYNPMSPVTYQTDNSCTALAPPLGTCPTYCGYTGGDEIDDGACGKITCPAITPPADQNCPNFVGFAGGYYDDGICGKKWCPEIPLPGVTPTPPSCPPRESCTGNEGSVVENGDCSQRFCPPAACSPVSGGWSLWSGCTASCGQDETRTCDNPSPSCGGSTCGGTSNRTCGSLDATTPALVTIQSPLGAPIAPVKYLTDTPNITLIWNASFDPKATGYQIGVWDSNGNQIIQRDINNISTTTALINANTLNPGEVYHWQVNVINDKCQSIGVSTTYLSGWSTPGYFTLAIAAGIQSFEIRNESDQVVAPEAGNRNHICQPEFTNRTVRFAIQATSNNITTMELRLNGEDISQVSLVNGIGIFQKTYGVVTPSMESVEIRIVDSVGNDTGWVNTSRFFRLWNCDVSVSGSVYDGSNATFGIIDCASNSPNFANLINLNKVFNLNFESMNSSAIESAIVSDQKYISTLKWGSEYVPRFTSFEGGAPSMRIAGNNTCQNTLLLNSSTLDPYSNNLSLVVDFSSAAAQFPWFQVAGGGIMAKESITNNIPMTCVYDSESGQEITPTPQQGTYVSPTRTSNNVIIPTPTPIKLTEGKCKPMLAINATNAQSGIISAKNISRGEGSYSQTGNWNTTRNIVGTVKSYKYFYNEYHSKLSQGSVAPADIKMSEIKNLYGGTGVVFVEGNLNVDVNNVVAPGSFFMVVVKGNITVYGEVDRTDGIYITEGNLNVSESSDNQLNIQGSIYAKNSVILSRGFNNTYTNNTTPSVIVTYRPDFVFTMPGKMAKTISNWKEGI